MPYRIGKLGKLPAKHDPRTLRLANYISKTALKESPPEIRWSKAVPSFPMYNNDQIGCCAICGPAHQIQAWTANDSDSGGIVTPTFEQVLQDYQKIGGYIPGRPETDNGCYLLNVMSHWRTHGVCGHRIGAYALVNVQSAELVKAGIHLFGGLCIGLMLPLAAMKHEVWLAPQPHFRTGRWSKGSWGGHCVELLDYNEQRVWCATWGGIKEMSWNFLQAYCDEGYVMFSRKWVGDDATAPNGFNAIQLAKDLGAIVR